MTVSKENEDHALEQRVHELERENRELRSYKNQIDCLINTMDDAILMSDRNALPVFFNAAYSTKMKELLNLDMRPGLQPHTLLPPEEGAVWEDFHRRVLAGESFVAEFEFAPEGRTPQNFETSYEPIHNGDEVVGFAEVTREITTRKQAEAEIRKLNEELENRVRDRTAKLAAINTELEAFAFSVSHDLRAPLRSITGFSQALVEDCGEQLGDPAREYLNRIRAGCDRMALMIEQILTLSRLNYHAVNVIEVDMAALSRRLIDELQRAEPERSVEFITRGELRVASDPVLVETILENLLGNAWKFTRPRSDPRIELVEVCDQGVRHFEVRDNGIGFDNTRLDRLFRIFKRLHSANEFEGDGVGLAIVKRVISRLGGEISARGEVGRGAVFRFTIASDTIRPG